MAGSAGRVQTPARVQLLQLQRPQSLVELRHREDDRRLLGFRRRQFRRPQRGGAQVSGQLPQIGGLERPSLELNGHQTVEIAIEKQ